MGIAPELNRVSKYEECLQFECVYEYEGIQVCEPSANSLNWARRVQSAHLDDRKTAFLGELHDRAEQLQQPAATACLDHDVSVHHEHATLAARTLVPTHS